MTVRRYFILIVHKRRQFNQPLFNFIEFGSIRRSRRFAKASKALKTETEYLINVTRWSPLGRTVKREMVRASQLI